MVEKRWRVAEAAPEEAKLAWSELSPVLARLLWNRGIRTQSEADIFLGPDWSRDTHDPFLFRQMREAVTRTFKALENSEVITIFGDFDADGVCGTAVVYSTLREICRALKFDLDKITTYIPHREREGYGLFPSTVEHLRQHDKTDLLITVDCGISNAEAIARGCELGFETIICDHHAVPEILPKAIILHPQVPGETYLNKVLCGAGVAFKFASALITEGQKHGLNFPFGYEKWLLDLVSIATVTDIVPLMEENRVLETFGLLVLKKTRRLGLQKLFQAAAIKPEQIDTWTIGFQIGPRLNAAGRMDHADPAFRLLVSEDEQEAGTLAAQLHAANVLRQRRGDEIYKEALAQIGELDARKLLVAAAEGWSAGLVGLVAGKLCDRFARPAIVAARDGDKFTGSGRSIPAFDIMKAVNAAAPFLERYGGHPQACGFSTTGEERFRQAVEAMTVAAEAELKAEDLFPEIFVDAIIPLSAVNWELEAVVSRLAPFGEGNLQPVFASHGLQLVSFGTMGQEEKHLQLVARDLADGTIKKLVAFGFGSLAPTLSIGRTIDAAYTVSVHEWNGNKELQLKVVDFRIS